MSPFIFSHHNLLVLRPVVVVPLFAPFARVYRRLREWSRPPPALA